ncbi:FecR family protein [Sphingobium amiense]|nr:FecR domain-containing protein [Sphingobium amiense]
MDADLPEAMLLEAAQWHVRCEDERADAMDWDAFTAWLEADPRHRVALDQMALTADRLEAHGGALFLDDVGEQPSQPASRGRGRWAWGGLAVAASLAAMVAVPLFTSAPSTRYVTHGTVRRIALSDGSSVLLAPHSRLLVGGRGGDHIEVAGGAMFDIRHDPSRTLTVDAGGVRISDIGTRFDVQQDRDVVRVSVAEGRVTVNGDAMARPVALDAGSGLTFDAGRAALTLAPVRPADVGAWQAGRLTYDNASLALVLADLRRYAGVRVDAPPALEARRFSGTLIVDDGDKALRDLVGLLGLRLRGHAGDWRVEPN